MKKFFSILFLVTVATGTGPQIASADVDGSDLQPPDIPPPPPVVTTDSQTSSRSLVYDSLGRMSFAGSEIDFAMLPPSGWQQKKHLAGRSAVFEAPESDGYRATLAVQLNYQPVYFDKTGIEEITEEIVQKVARQGGTIPDFEVLKSELVRNAEGRGALLVYTTFSIETVRLMQAHLVLSNDSGHIVISFTDIASRFNFNDTQTAFHQAWKSMMSASLSGPTPRRYVDLMKYSIYALFFMAGIMVILAVRRHRSTAAVNESLTAKKATFKQTISVLPPPSEHLDREFTGKEPVHLSDVMSKEAADAINESIFSADMDDTGRNDMSDKDPEITKKNPAKGT